MSLFMGNLAGGTVDPEKIKVATVQFEAQSLIFNKVLYNCQSKCMGDTYAEGDLGTGEQSCVDRCVAKFFKANQLIGKEVQYNRMFNVNKMPEYEKVKLMMKEN